MGPSSPFASLLLPALKKHDRSTDGAIGPVELGGILARLDPAGGWSEETAGKLLVSLGAPSQTRRLELTSLAHELAARRSRSEMAPVALARSGSCQDPGCQDCEQAAWSKVLDEDTMEGLTSEESAASAKTPHAPAEFATAVGVAAARETATWVRESGMPPQEYWERLVDAEGVLDALGFRFGQHARALELGCGYGTFSIPVGHRVREYLQTYDLVEGMVDHTLARASVGVLWGKVRAEVRDVVAEGYGAGASDDFDAVLLFNILHCEDPVAMLKQAALALRAGGKVYAIHWNHDPDTPRGPPMAIRPRPGQLEEWALATGLLETERGPVDCPPWHYGWVFTKRL